MDLQLKRIGKSIRHRPRAASSQWPFPMFRCPGRPRTNKNASREAGVFADLPEPDYAIAPGCVLALDLVLTGGLDLTLAVSIVL